VAFSADGNKVVSGTVKCTWLWDLATGEWTDKFEGRTDAVAFHGDILACAGETTVRLWNVSTTPATWVRTLEGHTDFVSSVAFAPDGRVIASGAFDNLIKLWSAETGECLRTLAGHTDYVRSVAFSSDGALLASCGDDKMVRVWDHAATGSCWRVLKGHTDIARCVVWHDRSTLVSCGDDISIRFWAL
jgi:WD40 repeat protein